MLKQPVKVAITGAAGQICYSLLFRIANGDMLGKDQPIILQLLDLPQAQDALKGVVMELADCAFPLLVATIATDNPEIAFKDVKYALLVGSKPRSKGMERKDLLGENGKIFTLQGLSLGQYAHPDCKILIVGNPANTNALITRSNAIKHGRLKSENITSMIRLDHNRSISQLASKLAVPLESIEKIIVWGNHSPTMYADYRFATTGVQSIKQLINDEQWNRDVFLPTVAKRGAAIINARGLSSAASAANAAIDHMRDWVLGSQGKWVSMGIYSDGSYGIPAGLMFGMPVICENGHYTLVKDLNIDDPLSKEKIAITIAELEEEKLMVKDLL